MVSSSRKWLSLKVAADLLGVHPTTLRRWADNGDVPVYVTPGGHRRFLEYDVRAMIDNQLTMQPNGIIKAWASNALVATQQRLQMRATNTQWLQAFDADRRAEQRELGKRLLGLIMQHISLPDDDESLLAEAAHIATRYAKNCAELGLTADQSLEIVIFFRDAMIETALQLPQIASFDDEMRLRLMRRINQVFNLIQVTLVKHYKG
jgi:excisionase family DNA binding protein